MKQLTINSVVRTLVVLSFLLPAGVILGQSAEMPMSGKKYEMGVKNLKAAISSDNPGLRRSSIYLAGKYKIREVATDLFAQLKKEKDPSTRILIGMSIYSLGEENSMLELRKVAGTEKDNRVKRMLSEICNQFTYSAADLTALDVQ
jgi:hypothetical protein